MNSEDTKPDRPEWSIPTPSNYFNGLKMGNLTLADNILFFLRTTRSFLNVRNFESRPHHRFVLIFNCKTKGSVNVDGDTYHMFPNQAFLIAPLQFHFYLEIPEEEISWIYMTFESEHPEQLAPLKNLPLEMDNEDWRILNTVLSQYEQLEATLHNGRQNEINTNIWILQCNRLIQRLLSHANQKINPDFQNLKVQKPDQMIRKINQFLEEDTYQHADLTTLAQSLHISPSHLRRRFRSITGLSLGNYQIHYRMNRAIKYLVNTNTPLTEIAEISGYNSLAAFSRSFKLHFGVTPSQYRKQNSA